MIRFSVLSLLLSILFSIPSNAQDKKKEWDVNNPPGDWNFKEVSFEVKEGTWMNLDLSPDGKTIAFDLLGDIYTIPFSGGQATVLRSGLAWEVQPRFSPDGKKLLFTSDAGGGDNIWSMNVDGSNAKQITKEDFRLLNNPAWMPDGEYFVARKHFTSGRSIGAGEIWMYHITGGSGIQLTKRKNDQQDVNEPSVSPDGRYIYFSEDMYPGGYFKYNKDPNSQIYVVRRYDRVKAKVENVVQIAGGAFRPQVSNDGSKLAFIHRVRTKTVLAVHDLKTGENYSLYEDLGKDQQEAWAVFGAYTGFDWTNDDKEIVIWSKGKILKINVDSKAAIEIPFKVNAKHQLAETLEFPNKAFEEEFDVHVLRNLTTSPNGKFVLFNAVGHLWKAKLPNGKPKRLLENENFGFAFEPSFNKTGDEIVFVSWSDEDKGAIWKYNLTTETLTKLSVEKGIYRSPSFSPDGKTIVFRRDGGNSHQGFTYCKSPGIYTISAMGGEAKFVSEKGEYPVFNKDGDRIYFQTGGFIFGNLTKSYFSVKTDGTDEMNHFKSKFAHRFAVSPDNEWVAWSELYKVYVAPFPKTGKVIELNSKTKAVPVAQVARDAGINLHWSPDSKKIAWTLGNEYFSNELKERFLFLEGAVDSLPPIDTVGFKIDFKLKSDKPEGFVALTNGRIITMEGDEIINEGTVIIKDNIIIEMGTSAEVKIPSKAKVIDCSGKTIMPGIIDVHGHLGNFRYGISPEQQWEYFANLAFGVTTAHDPSSNSEMIFSQSEMIKAGEMIGPRLYSTGTILYGAEGDFKAVINNLEDARSAIRRTKAYGAFSVKSYNQPRRNQRQQVIQAAKELDIIVVPEGGSFFYHNMSMIVDGHTGVEHNIPVAPLYDDVIQLWKRTNTHNTPTLIVNYGSVNGEYYWYQNTNVWENERLLNFTPRSVVDSRARHRTMIPDEEYKNGHILTSESCTKLQAEGVNINLGGHGQLQGLGAHWELWNIQQGGMSNHQALKCATINGAEYLGMEAQIGSLKEGKLADILVLDENPLEDIQNSTSIRYTIVNGRVYDAELMNETGNYDKKRKAFYFETEGDHNMFPLMNQGGNHSGCSCGK